MDWAFASVLIAGITGVTLGYIVRKVCDALEPVEHLTEIDVPAEFRRDASLLLMTRIKHEDE